PSEGRFMLRAETISDLHAVERWRDEWDGLAVNLGRPFCSPGWMLSWYRHVAPLGSLVRVLLAIDSDRLVGVAPFWVEWWRGMAGCRVLGAGTTYRVEPLCHPGRERETGRVFAQALAEGSPRPDILTFEAIPSSSVWPGILRDSWPGPARPWLHQDRSVASPALTLAGRSYQEWFRSKSRNFRHQM